MLLHKPKTSYLMHVAFGIVFCQLAAESVSSFKFK